MRDAKKIVKLLLNSRISEYERVSALRALKKIENPEALIAVLRNPGSDLYREDISRVVKERLVEIGKAAVPGLLKAFKHDKKRDAAIMLGQIGDVAAVPTLTWALTNNYFRSEAAIALGKIGDASAVPALIRALTENHSSEVATALGQIGDASAVPALNQALSSEYEAIRIEAATALGQIGKRVGADWAVPSLILALTKKGTLYTSAYSDAVINSLAQLGDSRAAPALIQYLWENKFDMRAGLNALTRLGPAVIPEVIQAIKDSRDRSFNKLLLESIEKQGWRPVSVQELIIYYITREDWKGLSELGDRSAKDLTEVLININKDGLKWEDRDIDNGVAGALIKIGPAAVPFLLQALDNADLKLLERLIGVLGQIGDESAIHSLVAYLGRCSSARSAFVKIGRAAVPALLIALGHEATGAATALGQIGDVAAVPALIQALTGRLSGESAIALGQIGDTVAVPALIQALTENQLCEAATALGQIGDDAAIPALVRALTSPCEETRVAAVKVLKKFGFKPIDPEVKVALIAAEPRYTPFFPGSEEYAEFIRIFKEKPEIFLRLLKNSIYNFHYRAEWAYTLLSSPELVHLTFPFRMEGELEDHDGIGFDCREIIFDDGTRELPSRL